jgi:hypothetical protein
MLTTSSSLNSMWLRDQSAQRLSRDRKDRSLAERQRGVTTMRAHRRDEGERDLEDRLSRGDGTPEEALDWFQRHEFPERSTPPTWDGERWLFTDGTDDDFDDFDDVAPAPGRGSLADPGTGNAPGTSSLPYDGPWSSRRVIPPALWSTDIRPTPAPRPLPPVGPVDPSRLPKPRPLDKFRPPPEVVPGLIGPSLEVVEQRTRAALESLELQTQSALASAFVAISTLRGERSPERLLAVAQAGHLLGEFASVIAGVAPHAVRVRNPAVDSVRDRKAPQVQKPIRTAQSVVQAKVDEFVKDFHREPARIADHVSEKEVHAVAAAVEQFHAGTMTEGQLRAAVGRTFGKALEARTVEWGQREGLLTSIGQTRDRTGRFTTTPDLRFTTGEFKGEKIEITTFRSWVAHAQRDWGLDSDLHYVGYEVAYPSLLKRLLGR